MIFVIGGSGSGKSSYAEERITLLSEGIKKYYLATMQIYDREGEEKAERHRSLRNGKGFITVEQPAAIQNALKKMEAGDKTALLECISNLAANEMFSGEIPKSAESITKEIIRGIEVLKGELMHFVAVSNNVFEDGLIYDEATMQYIRAMGRINEALSRMADETVEVVAGIPMVLKSWTGSEAPEGRKKGGEGCMC